MRTLLILIIFFAAAAVHAQEFVVEKVPVVYEGDTIYHQEVEQFQWNKREFSFDSSLQGAVVLLLADKISELGAEYNLAKSGWQVGMIEYIPNKKKAAQLKAEIQYWLSILNQIKHK